MRITPGRLFLIIGAGAVATGILSVVLEAAGDDVSLGVAIAALAAMGLAAVLVLVRVARVYRSVPDPTEPNEEATRRLRRIMLVHVAVLWSMPFVVFAASPWGPASGAIGWAAALLCQAVISHGLIVMGLMARRRARQAPAP